MTLGGTASKYFMLMRWLELYEYIKSVNPEIRAEEGANGRCIFLFGGANFKNSVEKYAGYFAKFHKTHVAMEGRGLTLSECRGQLDSWVMMMGADLPADHDLFGCELEMKYISDDANIIENADFERGVVKIQRGEACGLTDLERVAVSSLLRDAPAGADAADSGAEQLDPDPALLSSPTSLAKAMDRKRKRDQARSGGDTYINCEYITGSVAEVERLWSLAHNILTYERMSTKPMNVEGLLFLKVNKRFWDEATVQEALNTL
jgi:hypothetical protein